MKRQLTRAAVWELNSVLKRIAERIERNNQRRVIVGKSHNSDSERENDRLAALVQDAMQTDWREAAE